MQLVRFGPDTGRALDRFGSAGALLTPLARDAAQVVVVHLEAGGRLGRHRAVGAQLLVVVAGDGFVSGTDGVEHRIGPGTAAVWTAGEEHETRTDSGLTAVIVEGEQLDVLARP